MYQNVFKRYEKKYLLDEFRYNEIHNALSLYTVPDKYPESMICSLYYDTPDYRLIRASLESPVYKEKLRVRCYGVPDDSRNCFIELKKKYKGIVYKRRIHTTYGEGINFLSGFDRLNTNAQIEKEIDYFLKFYDNLTPKCACFYDRQALYSREDANLRITFDRNIIGRTYDCDLRLGSYGTPILAKNYYLMEIKTADAMPIWLADLLDKFKIYPTSFSKYGTTYCKMLQNKTALTGGNDCA